MRHRPNFNRDCRSLWRGELWLLPSYSSTGTTHRNFKRDVDFFPLVGLTAQGIVGQRVGFQPLLLCTEHKSFWRRLQFEGRSRAVAAAAMNQYCEPEAEQRTPFGTVAKPAFHFRQFSGLSQYQ